jgi:hypothetical protein
MEEARETVSGKTKRPNGKAALAAILGKRWGSITEADKEYVYVNVILNRLEDIETMLVYEAKPLWEIAQTLGIKYRILYELATSESHAELHAVYMREEAKIRRVEDSLYRSSCGFYVTEEVPMKVKVATEYVNKKGKACKKTEEQVRIVPIQRYVEPDVNAMKFLLTNRDPKDWKNDIKLAQDEITAPSKPEPIEVVFVDPHSEENEKRLKAIQTEVDKGGSE